MPNDGMRSACAALDECVRFAFVQRVPLDELIDDEASQPDPPWLRRHLLAGIDTPALGYRCTEHLTTAHAMHFILTKRA